MYASRTIETTMTGTPKKIIVTGDHAIDRFLYIQGWGSEPPHLYETWVEAKKHWNVPLPGGAGALIKCLEKMGDLNVHDPDPFKDENVTPAESLYLLTKDVARFERPEAERLGAQVEPKWRIGQHVVIGERELPCYKIHDRKTRGLDPEDPVIILDFNQGWIKHNHEKLPDFLEGRKCIIRTHDPRSEHYEKIRSGRPDKILWFCTLQDMAKGGLKFAGNWEDIRERVNTYLRDDPCLWNREENKWNHKIIIQVFQDGALFLSPDEKYPDGRLFIFAGDQPGSFGFKGYQSVLGGGIVFLASLAKWLHEESVDLNACIEAALRRLRLIFQEGYEGPSTSDETEWKLESDCNLPVEIPDDPEKHPIIEYQGPPEGTWEDAKTIVVSKDNDYVKKTLLTVGSLVTCQEDYARMLLRLAYRVEEHVKSGTGILSFAILGEPGSGKTFVAEQLLNCLDPGAGKGQRDPEPGRKYLRYKHYNLSQFENAERLVDAFQEVQGFSLQNRVPFIVWDEFDTSFNDKQGGWLQYFLLPLEKAKFFSGRREEDLRKGIFVFVGGTFENEKSFREWAHDPERGMPLKGRDFHSRLDSCVHAQSVKLSSDAHNDWKRWDPGKLVRATVIRQFLKDPKNKLEVKRIGQDVLMFLLHVPLSHGVRSLLKILRASELGRAESFTVHNLPPTGVLQLHVARDRLDKKDIIKQFLGEIGGGEFLEKPPIELEWKSDT